MENNKLNFFRDFFANLSIAFPSLLNRRENPIAFIRFHPINVLSHYPFYPIFDGR